MIDEFEEVMNEYDALLVKQGKSEDDIARIEAIEVIVIEKFGPCGGMDLLRVVQS